MSIGSLKLRTSAGLLIIGALLVFLGNNVLFENLGEDDGLPQFDSPGFFFVPPGGMIGPAGRGGVAGGPNVELAEHWTAPSEDLKNIPLEHRFATHISTGTLVLDHCCLGGVWWWWWWDECACCVFTHTHTSTQ